MLFQPHPISVAGKVRKAGLVLRELLCTQGLSSSLWKGLDYVVFNAAPCCLVTVVISLVCILDMTICCQPSSYI